MDNNIRYAGQTHVGNVRKSNQDDFIIDENLSLVVVIDGMGGHEGGEVATATVKEEIINYITSSEFRIADSLSILEKAVVSANNVLKERQRSQPEFYNMGCVLTAVMLDKTEKKVHRVHVGDTRLYQYDGYALMKLSHDQTLVGYLEEKGDLSEEEAMRHPRRNEILQYIGDKDLEYPNNYIESATSPMLPKSILLLCSDGLYDMITSEQMKEVLDTDISLEEKASTLINKALEAGGKDNVTVVLVKTDFEIEDKSNSEVEVDSIEAKPDADTEQCPVETEPNQNETVSETASMQSCLCKKASVFLLTITLFSILMIAVGFALGWFSCKYYDDYKNVQNEKPVSINERDNISAVEDKVNVELVGNELPEMGDNISED